MLNPNATYDVHQAALWLKQGKLLAYPTESVWGLGCDPFNESAVNSLLTLKNRPISKGLIVLIACHTQIKDFLDLVPPSNQQAIIASWHKHPRPQQATTWLLPVADKMTIPHWLTGGKDCLAIRQIAHDKIADLCTMLALGGDNPYGFLVSTSCNSSDKPPASNFDEAYAYFGDEICYLLGEGLGFDKPSCIRGGLTGEIIRH